MKPFLIAAIAGGAAYLAVNELLRRNIGGKETQIMLTRYSWPILGLVTVTAFVLSSKGK